MAFIWKEPGTPSIHMPQTHAIVKLMRVLADYAVEKVILLTETNVPNDENLSYFGAGAYGFTMASNYNSRGRPPEVMVDGECAHLVRERETTADLMRTERCLPDRAPAAARRDAGA